MLSPMSQRVFRWAGIAALLILMTRLTYFAAQPLSNADTWFNLRLGRDLGAPWDWSDPPSWSTYATADWVPTQPLAAIVMSAVEQVAGIPGIAWLYGVGLLAFLLTVYGICRAQASPLVAALGTCLAMIGASGSLSARPQLISLILVPLVVHVWLRTEQDGRPRWWLIPLTWVWAMCHGFWIVGVAIGFVVVAGMMVDGRPGRRGRRGRHGRRDAARLALVPLVSLVVAALTPVGPRLLLTPFAVSDRSELISEWQRASFASLEPWPAAIMVVLAAGILASRKMLTVPEALLLLMAVGGIFLNGRTVALAGLIAVPMFVRALQEQVSFPVDHASRRVELRRLWLAGAAMAVVLGVVVPHTADEPSDVPAAFSARLSTVGEGETILNDPSAGSWLVWRNPQVNVVVDGLFDAYPVGYLRRTHRAMQAQPGWEGYVARADPVLAVLESREPLVDALQEDGWTLVDEDGGYVLLEPPANGQS